MSEPSAQEWLRRLEAKELSARELTGHYLARIEELNPPLNAIVAIDAERALAEAERADAARAAGQAGALLGLPLTIKDSIEVEGLRASVGSFAREGFMPACDATVVARVRSAGAVILGKSNVPEYISSFETDNALYGRTNNPHDLARTPGGSSGGEAAILAADASPLGLGSDGGGSIRVPAHYCGVVGLRPTVGLVPETGAWPPSRATGSLDIHTIGPMGRFVEDVALLLDVIAGPDGVDPFAVPVALGDRGALDPTSLTIGLYVNDPLATPTAETKAAVHEAGRVLDALGATVVEVTPPGCVSEATELFFAASGADGGARMRRDAVAARCRHHAQFTTLLSWGADEPPPSAASFFATLGRIHAFRATMRSFISGFDALVCPVAAGPAPRHGMPPANVPVGDYFRYEAFNYTHTYSLAGAPVAVVPVSRDPDGLPIGVQIVAQPYRDHAALGVANLLDAELRPHRP